MMAPQRRSRADSQSILLALSFCALLSRPTQSFFAAKPLQISAFLPALRPSHVAAVRSSRRQLRRSLVTAQLAADDGDNEEADGEEKKKKQPRGGDLALPHDGGVPLSYRSDNGTRDTEFYLDAADKDTNPYFDVVRRLSPAELIGRFVKTSSPRVQEAVRTTVLGLLGSLPRHAIETTAISTGSALANLMFQLQMTGYMFRNAEYRLSLQTSLRATNALPPGADPAVGASSGSAGAAAASAGAPGGELAAIDSEVVVPPKPKITGKIKLVYENQQEVEVDAEAYMGELATQVEKLSTRLQSINEERETAAQRDLLSYIKSMPPSQISSLSENISPEVLDSMKTLVNTVMRSMGGGEMTPVSLVQQPGAGMAQLCMWQLVVGYNLREMEAREELRKRFEATETSE